MTTALTWRRLGDLVEVVSGQVDPTLEPFASMPHVGGDNIERDTGKLHGMKTARELGLRSGKYLFDETMILYSKIRPVLNKVVAPSFAGVCSADIYPLRPRQGELDRAYLVYLLRSRGFLSYARSRSGRTNIPKLNRPALLDYKVAVPVVHEQRRIAAILDKADAIRRKRQEALRLTDDLLRSAFLEMFGDPVTNPKRWPVVRLSEVTTESRYGTPEPSNSSGIGVPILRMGNLTADGRVILNDLKWCTLSKPHLDLYTLCKGDLLFNRTNSPELVGKTAVWKGDGLFAFAGYLIRLRFTGNVRAEYVSAFLNSTYGKTLLASCAKPSINMSNISATVLGRLRLPLPPLHVQERFVAFVGLLDSARHRLVSAADDDGVIFDSLAQRAFSGGL